MKDYQIRVVTERDELSVKIETLTKFIDHSDQFRKLDEFNSTLLVEQLSVMTKYRMILDERINLFV